MIKRKKAAARIGILALCLLLSACGTAPEDGAAEEAPTAESEERLGSLAGIHWRNSDDDPEPPYYLIDYETVDEETFRAAVQEQITDRRFDDADWSPIPADSEEKLRQAFSAWERANGY